MSKRALAILLLLGTAAGQTKPSHAPEPETPHLRFVKEYVRELIEDESLKINGEKEFSEAKTYNEQFSTGIYVSKSVQQTAAAIFAILGQERKPRPKPRRWADSVERDFGRDPLLDHAGKRMKWTRRIKAEATP